MKKYLMLILITLIGFLLNGEIIKLKNGNIIKGKIIKENDKYVIIETDNNKIDINKNDITKIYYNDNEYYDEYNDKINKKNTEKELFDKTSINKKLSKKYLKAGIGLIIAGTIVLSCSPLPFSILTDLNNYGFYPDIQPIFTLSLGIGLINIGMVFDIISIVMFGFSANAYKKFKKEYKEKYSFNIIINRNNNNPKIGFVFRIKK